METPLNEQLVTFIQKYPDYKITGALHNNISDWGRLVDIVIMHHIKTIKLIFGYEF